MIILFLTDTHLISGPSVFDKNVEAIRTFIAGNPVDMVVHLGDITANGASHPDQLEYAARCFQGLGAPVKFIPGNHDIGDNPIAPGQGGYEPLQLDRLADYRRVFGPDCWSLDLAGWQLVGLNAQLFGTGTEAEAEQFAWLETSLQASDGPLGVALHKPLFRNGHADDEAHIRYVPAAPRRRLVDMLGTRDLKFVVSGHVHQDRRIVVDGVGHIWVPSASFCMPDAMQERIGDKIVGVLVLELEADGAYRAERPQVEGLVRHNILHFPEIYPTIAELRARLGAAAEL